MECFELSIQACIGTRERLLLGYSILPLASTREREREGRKFHEASVRDRHICFAPKTLIP